MQKFDFAVYSYNFIKIIFNNLVVLEKNLLFITLKKQTISNK